MSNLTDLINALKGVGSTNQNAINVTGALVGTVADFASFVGVVKNVLQFLGILTDASQQSTEALLNVLTSLQNELNTESLLAHLRDLESQMEPAEAVFAQLKATLNASPPISSDEILRQIGICYTALVSLEPDVTGEPDTKWRVDQFAQVYFPWPGSNTWYAYYGGGIPSATFSVTPSNRGPWQEFGYKGLRFAYMFVPTPDRNGLVFSHIYVLPLYLRALMMFLAVGAVLDPKFVANYSEELRAAADFLLAKHDKIQNEGIVNLPAPNSDDVIGDPLTHCSPDIAGEPLWMSQWASGVYEYTPWDGATSPPVNLFSWPGPFGPDFRQPFGAVDIFSGFSSIGSYQWLSVPLGSYTYPSYSYGPYTYYDYSSPIWAPLPRPSDDWFLGFFSKYLIRSLKRRKDVYRGLGLPEVRKCVNRLRALVGDSPVEGRSFGDWSLREVLEVAGGRLNPWLGGPGHQPLGDSAPFSLRNLVYFLIDAPRRQDTTILGPPSPTSLRQLLEDPDYVVFTQTSFPYST